MAIAFNLHAGVLVWRGLRFYFASVCSACHCSSPPFGPPAFITFVYPKDFSTPSAMLTRPPVLQCTAMAPFSFSDSSRNLSMMFSGGVEPSQKYKSRCLTPCFVNFFLSY